jgi:hypothetical protein
VRPCFLVFVCENEFWFGRALSAFSTREASLTENTADGSALGLHQA